MIEIKTTIEGREVKAFAEMVNGVLWLHHDGRNYSFDSRQAGTKKRKAQSGAAAEEIESPMPGKITKLLKVVGDSVKKGEAVVVMEAMKMEYTLKSEIDGTVSEIACKMGDQVGLGQRLVGFKGTMK